MYALDKEFMTFKLALEEAQFSQAELTRPNFEDGLEREAMAQCQLAHDIFGNPFHPVTIDPAWLAWNNGTIVKLAQTIYDERELPSGHLDTGRLAILADALEDAGCTNADILAHCRSAGPHVRGCWVVDLLLCKE